MFAPKHVSAEHLVAKFKDDKKAPLKRLQALRTFSLASTITEREKKAFFAANYNAAFDVAFTFFSQLPLDAIFKSSRPKGPHDSHKCEPIDLCISVIENTIPRLPPGAPHDWQAKSMETILARLLGSAAHLSWRKTGIGILTSWLYAYRDGTNAFIFCSFAKALCVPLAVPSVNVDVIAADASVLPDLLDRFLDSLVAGIEIVEGAPLNLAQFEFVLAAWLQLAMPVFLPATCAEIALDQLPGWSKHVPRAATEDRTGPNSAAFLMVVQHWLGWLSGRSPRLRTIREYICGDAKRVALAHAIFGRCLESREPVFVAARTSDDAASSEPTFTWLAAKRHIVLLYQSSLKDLENTVRRESRESVSSPLTTRPKAVSLPIPFLDTGLGPSDQSTAGSSPPSLVVPAQQNPQRRSMLVEALRDASPDSSGFLLASQAPGLWKAVGDMRASAPTLLRYLVTVFTVPIPQGTSAAGDAALHGSVCEIIIAFLQSLVIHFPRDLEACRFFDILLPGLDERLATTENAFPHSKALARTVVMACVHVSMAAPLPRDAWAALTAAFARLARSPDFVSEWSSVVLACTRVVRGYFQPKSSPPSESDDAASLRGRHTSMFATHTRAVRLPRRGGDDLDVGLRTSTPRQAVRASGTSSNTASLGSRLSIPRSLEEATCHEIDTQYSDFSRVMFAGVEAALACWQNLLGFICTGTTPATQAMGLKTLQEAYAIVRDAAAEPYVPHFAPWVLEIATQDGHSEAKSIAFQMVCDFALSSAAPPPLELSLHLDVLLVKALRDFGNKEMLYAAIRNSARLYTRVLPGSSALMLDCIAAVRAVVGHGFHRPQPKAGRAMPSEHLKDAPRKAAVTLLMSLTCFPELYDAVQLPTIETLDTLAALPILYEALPEFPRLIPKTIFLPPAAAPGNARAMSQDSTFGFSRAQSLVLAGMPPGSPRVSTPPSLVVTSYAVDTAPLEGMARVKHELLVALRAVLVDESDAPTRCIALNALTVLCMAELAGARNELYLRQIIDSILAFIRIRDISVARTAIAMLHFLAEQYPHSRGALDIYLPTILRALNRAILYVLPVASKSRPRTIELLPPLLLCLLEWILAVPPGQHADIIENSARILVELSGELNLPAIEALKRACDLEEARRETVKDAVGPEGNSFAFYNHNEIEAILINREEEGEYIASATHGKKHRLRKGPTDSPGPIQPDEVPLDTFMAQPRALATYVIGHIVQHLGAFPTADGCALIGTLATEADGGPDPRELSEKNLLERTHPVQMLCLHDAVLVSLVQLETKTRVILRTVHGKWAWDAVQMGEPDLTDHLDDIVEDLPEEATPQREASIPVAIAGPAVVSALPTPMPPASPSAFDRAVPTLLPSGLPSLDAFTDFAQSATGIALQIVPDNFDPVAFEEAAVSWTSRRASAAPLSRGQSAPCLRGRDPAIAPPLRRVLNDLGVVTWAGPRAIRSLTVTEKLLRNIAHLDKAGAFRGQYKVGVIFIGARHEGKTAIITAAEASAAFDAFVGTLGWLVSIDAHQGYLGSLKRDVFVGCHAPYFATSTLEVFFHVSTMLTPTHCDDLGKLYQTRWAHIGNDPVHVIWTERGVDHELAQLPTEFGEVTIVIYPLQNAMFRIQILLKRPITLLGPLVDGSVVSAEVLGPLVRATAVNASKQLRAMEPYAKPYYATRQEYIASIVRDADAATPFDTHCALLLAPVAADGALDA
eukprot:m.118263 g.118263  ORF g.118263 m.118263 type:complete len:1710 (+) comp9227_c0_seq2:89-5218(+)